MRTVTSTDHASLSARCWCITFSVVTYQQTARCFLTFANSSLTCFLSLSISACSLASSFNFFAQCFFTGDSFCDSSGCDSSFSDSEISISEWLSWSLRCSVSCCSLAWGRSWSQWSTKSTQFLPFLGASWCNKLLVLWGFDVLPPLAATEGFSRMTAPSLLSFLCFWFVGVCSASISVSISSCRCRAEIYASKYNFPWQRWILTISISWLMSPGGGGLWISIHFNIGIRPNFNKLV